MLATLAWLALLPQAAASGPAPAIDLAAAKRVFDVNCAGCHGVEGQGGRGPSLAVPKLRRANTDPELGQLILNGIPGTAMPPSWHLGEQGITLAAVYVRVLGARAATPKVDGDVVKGGLIFAGKGGCTGCHTLGPEGHAYGPDLSSIGERRGEMSLRQSLIEPGAEVGDDYIPVRALTRRGEKINGIRVNEDNFTIQILELSGRLHSLRKAALAELEKPSGESPMPTYKSTLSDSELQDLIAYLSSLRGQP